MKFSIQVEDGGRIFVQTYNKDGVPHRRPIAPGDMGGGPMGGVYQETDVSGESAVIQAVAAEAWTADVKAAWQATCEATHKRQQEAEAAQAEAVASAEASVIATRERRAAERGV